MLNFRKINTITGWIVFLFAFTVYVLTVEPTASFWDCGEFIACAFKLMVPHPPGAPVFLIVGRLFSMLAGGDVTQVAWWINISSALFSAFTILFLFWTITLLAKKLIPTPGNSGEESHKTAEENPGYSGSQIISIIGSGVVGALACTFADSFWFSAVEAEVYAMSQFFTAFVVWAIFKWETIAEKEDSDKWLVLIAFMMGLSIGVHLLNLVTIPAMAFVFYFKKYKTPKKRGIILTFIISFLILFAIMIGVIQGLPSVAGKFELFFVNNFGFTFGTGILIFGVLFLGALVYGIVYSIREQKRVLNTALLCLTFILIGYSAYAIIFIRSNFNPPLDENDPENIIKFVSYLKREQYGERPLLYGPYYTAKLTDQKQGDPIYRKDTIKGSYEIYHYKLKNFWDKDHQTLFPRSYSMQGNHVKRYREIMDKPRGEELRSLNERLKAGLISQRQYDRKTKPTMADNLTVLFKYQLGHMYWRYFLWNFSGRDGDVQNDGWRAPWDSSKDMPAHLAKNKAINNFYMLPLILGLIGLFYQFKKNKKDVFIVLLLFFLTGMALTLYLNSPPIEPRERDYIFAGSFITFCIWIGLGVMSVSDALGKALKNNFNGSVLACLLCLPAPLIMAAVGWDDHSRAKRYLSVDSAKNLLNSCAKNAILFTGGDNDTFPVWYVQEVEGFRTDVRVCNLSLLNTDWYIGQMKRQAYDSDPLPISLEHKNFIQGTNDYIQFFDNPGAKDKINLKSYNDNLARYTADLEQYKQNSQHYSEKLLIYKENLLQYKEEAKLYNEAMNLVLFIEAIKEDYHAIRIGTSTGKSVNYYPSKNMILAVDKNEVIKKGIVPKGLEGSIVDKMQWNVKKRNLEKKDLIILDMLATNNWERPIYFSTTLAPSSYLNLHPYFQLEGLAYRLLPVKTKGAAQGRVNSDIMYENMMNNYFWRGLDNKDVFYNENYRRFPLNVRNCFYRLATQLISERKIDKAREVILKCFEVMPDESIPYDVYTSQFIPLLLNLGEDSIAFQLAETMGTRANEELIYYAKKNINNEIKIRGNLFVLNQIFISMKRTGKTEEAAKYENWFTAYCKKYPKYCTAR
ncbi:MAG: DUF2723 domain-containing protein [Cytophagales bacterium]|nr:DUF2723 domain-containing protein [Cytophagales bacterium]